MIPQHPLYNTLFPPLLTTTTLPSKYTDNTMNKHSKSLLLKRASPRLDAKETLIKSNQMPSLTRLPLSRPRFKKQTLNSYLLLQISTTRSGCVYKGTTSSGSYTLNV